MQGFFSKFLMGGPQNLWSPSGTYGDKDGWGGLRKNPTEAKTVHLMQNKAIFCCFRHEIQLLKVLLSLKVVEFDTKMYLNFSNFWRRTPAGGGTSLGPKMGTSVGWGIDKIFAGWGPPIPPPPPGKKPWDVR